MKKLLRVGAKFTPKVVAATVVGLAWSGSGAFASDADCTSDSSPCNGAGDYLIGYGCGTVTLNGVQYCCHYDQYECWIGGATYKIRWTEGDLCAPQQGSYACATGNGGGGN